MAIDYDPSTPGIQSMPHGMFRNAEGQIDMGPDVYAPRRNRRVSDRDQFTLGQLWGQGGRAGVDVTNLWRSWEDTGFKDYGHLARDWMFSTQWDDVAQTIDYMASARKQGYRDEDILELLKMGQQGIRPDFDKYRGRKQDTSFKSKLASWDPEKYTKFWNDKSPGRYNDEVSTWEAQNPNYWKENEGQYISGVPQMGRVYKGVGNSYFSGDVKDSFGHDHPWISHYRKQAEEGEWNPYANMLSQFNYEKIYGKERLPEFLRDRQKGNFEDYIYNLDQTTNANYEERSQLRSAINNLWDSEDKADWYGSKMDEDKFNRMGLNELGYKWDPEWESSTRYSGYNPEQSGGSFLEAFRQKRQENAMNPERKSVMGLFDKEMGEQ